VRRTAPYLSLNYQEVHMFRDIILWMAGVPIVVIILLHLVGVLHN
jgi:hypothetical protein